MRSSRWDCMSAEMPDFLWARAEDGSDAEPPEQQGRQSVVISGLPAEPGLWVFILGDMTVFGWFFLVFMWENRQDRRLFADSAGDLHQSIGVVNTLVLLASSLFVVLALHAHRNGRVRSLGRWLAAAGVCAAGFVGIKAIEYSIEIGNGHNPSENTFFLFYFTLTGIHLLHVLIGAALLFAWWRTARRGRGYERERVFAESAAVYWHMVDLLWIVIFTLLYLTSAS